MHDIDLSGTWRVRQEELTTIGEEGLARVTNMRWSGCRGHDVAPR